MHVIAAKAVCFKEAMSDEFVRYQKQVVANAAKLASVMMENGFEVVSGGTDNHLFLLDLSNKGLTGKAAATSLHKAGITVNKNTVPGEPRSPFVTSGLRLGTPAVTTRGFDEKDCIELAGTICDVLDHVGDPAVEAKARETALAMCHRHPVYHRC